MSNPFRSETFSNVEECKCSNDNLIEYRKKRLQEFAQDKVAGTLSFIYVLDLIDFVEIHDLKHIAKDYEYQEFLDSEPDGEKELKKYLLNSLRGTTEFREYLKELKPNSNGKSFRLAEEKQNAVVNGRDFSVFRGSLAKRWLEIPTFVFTGKDDNFNESSADVKYYFRLSTAGLIEITKEIPVADAPLTKVLEFLLQNRNPQNSNWKKATDYAQEFIKEIDWKSRVGVPAVKTLNFSPQLGDKELNRRQRYSVILLKKINCNKCSHRVSPATIHKEISLVQCLLEGTLIIEKNGELIIPEIPERKKKDIKDLSTWKDEICVFGDERCLIYFNEMDVMETTKNPKEPYELYWKCIVRGIEHSIAVRTALNILEAQTLKHMRRVPDLMLRVTDDVITDNDRKELKYFARRVVNILNLLPVLRRVTIPASSFRSTHAIEKFEYLNETCFHFSGILKNITSNIDELTNFLVFFKQQQLQITIDDGNTKISRRDSRIAFFALILTIISIFSCIHLIFI